MFIVVILCFLCSILLLPYLYKNGTLSQGFFEIQRQYNLYEERRRYERQKDLEEQRLLEEQRQRRYVERKQYQFAIEQSFQEERRKCMKQRRKYEERRHEERRYVEFPPINVSKRSKGETECMLVLEELFNTKFHTVRPYLLNFPETNRNLELDCYNSELKLAVEYNGRQHYQWPNFPGVTREKFYSQVRRDRFKLRKCNEYGIYLIVVPYTVKLRDIYRYILMRIPYHLHRKLERTTF